MAKRALVGQQLTAEEYRVHRRSQPGATTFDVTLTVGRDEALTSPQLSGFSLPVQELLDR
ncbi:MAG: hypothetical protein H0V52_06810 [Acidimicrobiia bacterium]|nr:hypothetical protein [Acidimicrobiia bacterium]